MPTPIKRLRAFWISHGEYALLGIVFALAASTSYGFAARSFQGTILEMQVMHRAELVSEREHFRAAIERKNQDIRVLQGIQGDMAKDASGSAKTSAEALKAASEGTTSKP